MRKCLQEKIEIIAKELTILNTSKTTPFKVNDDSTNEDLRLQYIDMST